MEDGTIERLLELRNSYVFLPCRKIERVIKLQNCSNKFDKKFFLPDIIRHVLYDAMEWDYVNSCYLSSRQRIFLEQKRNANYMELSRLTVLNSQYKGK